MSRTKKATVLSKIKSVTGVLFILWMVMGGDPHRLAV